MDGERNTRTGGNDGVGMEQKIAAALKRNRVPYVFGMPGGGSSIDLIQACQREGIPFVLLQHETAAALMATVCGDLTNSCGVSVSIMATGAANLAGGAAYAYLERHPLLCITECYGSEQAPKMSLQKIDHTQVFSAYCKDSITLGRFDAGSMIDQSVQLAKTERPGPIHLDYPMDPDAYGKSSTGMIFADVDSGVQSGDLDQVAATLNHAEKPLMIVGPVALRENVSTRVVELAERLQMPVMVTSKARGIISEDHPLYAGVMSGVYSVGTLEERIVSRSDVVLAVGLDRMELLSPWRYRQPILTLDVIEVNPNEVVSEPMASAVGPLRDTLHSLTLSVKRRTTWHLSEIEEFWAQAEVELGINRDELNASAVLSHARRDSPRDTIVTTEAGVYGRVSLYAWKVYEPLTYFDSSGANTMGFSVPAALGASLVRPEQKTICLVGDSGFLMRASELETAARCGLSPVIIIFDDGTLGMIRIKQKAKGYSRDGVDLAQTNFAQLAQSFGGNGWEVRTMSEFTNAFHKALDSDKLSVIDVRVDPDEYAGHIKPIRGM